MEGGPPIFRQDFTCPALLKDLHNLTHTGLSPAPAGLSRPFCFPCTNHWPRPLSLATTRGISIDLFSSRYLRCFSSPGSPRTPMDLAPDPHKGGVAPFGYPRIKACSRLPVAFRSVPRPSSPPGAKASTECPSHAQDNPCTETILSANPTVFAKNASAKAISHSAHNSFASEHRTAAGRSHNLPVRHATAVPRDAPKPDSP